MNPETVEISVAVLNFDAESRVFRDVFREIEALVHTRNEFTIGEPEFAMGWYFFTVSVSRGMIVKLANLLGNEFLVVKGKSFENKFVNWLSARLKKLGYRPYLHLKSEIETSKYGLF